MAGHVEQVRSWMVVMLGVLGVLGEEGGWEGEVVVKGGGREGGGKGEHE